VPVFGLAGLSRKAGHAGAPLIGALFAAVGRLRLREILGAQADESDDHYRDEATHLCRPPYFHFALPSKPIEAGKQRSSVRRVAASAHA